MEENMEENLTKKERRVYAKEKKRKERDKGDLQNKVKKIGLIVLVLSAVLFGGYKFVKWINTPQEEAVDQDVLLVDDNDWIKGNKLASATIVEYSDFQCPACASYAPILRRLSQEYPDNLRIVYRHYPLLTIHANAYNAAKAAEAAGKQGKFWEMHDKLFDNQGEWSSDGSPKDKFVSYANELELDEDRFLSDYKSDEVEEKVDRGLASATLLRLNSTPSFFFNGQRIKSATYDVFKGLIEESINDSN